MPTSQEECDALGVSCQSGNSVVLRNHGLLTVGASIAECFNNMFRLERACELQVMTLSCNTELQMPPAEVTQYTNNLMLPGVRRRFGLLEWPALLRKLDRKDPSYRD
jgi:ribulose-5-phosphate 4-epimerase/fuculose-1-phosphate aldolase